MRGFLIFGIIIGIILICAQVIMDRTGSGTDSIDEPEISCPSNQRQPTQLEILENGVVVLMNGAEEKGVCALNLSPSQKARVTYSGGRIVCTLIKKDGVWEPQFAPIWGHDFYNPNFNRETDFRYGYLPEVKPGSILVVVGKIGTGTEEVFYFPEGEKSIIVENIFTASRPVYLYYHDLLSEYRDNGWDGSRAKFKIELLK